MTQKECTYCGKGCKARGLKNHVRLASGDGHGPQGELPEDFDTEAAETVSERPEDSQDTQPVAQTHTVSDGTEAGQNGPGPDSTEPQEVTAGDLADTQPDTEPNPDEGDGLPFDPAAEGAIELDGDETLYVKHQGEVQKAPVEAGDWLLITPDGPILYDPDTDHRFEVMTE